MKTTESTTTLIYFPLVFNNTISLCVASLGYVDDIYKRMPNVFTNVNNKNAEIWVEFSDPIPVNYTLNIYYFCA